MSTIDETTKIINATKCVLRPPTVTDNCWDITLSPSATALLHSAVAILFLMSSPNSTLNLPFQLLLLHPHPPFSPCRWCPRRQHTTPATQRAQPETLDGFHPLTWHSRAQSNHCNRSSLAPVLDPFHSV
ncbi:unnamed protein product, partial [Ectocarpus sp. 12 AP-2014]